MDEAVEAGREDAEAQDEAKPDNLRRKLAELQKRVLESQAEEVSALEQQFKEEALNQRKHYLKEISSGGTPSTTDAEAQQGYESSLRQKEQELHAKMEQKKEKIERTIAEKEATLRRQARQREERRRKRADLESDKTVEVDDKQRMTHESASGLLERFDEEKNRFLAALTAERERQWEVVVTLKQAKAKTRHLKERKMRDAERLRFLTKQKELTQSYENVQRKKLFASQMNKKAKMDREEEEKRRGERLLALQSDEKWPDLMRFIVEEERSAGVIDLLEHDDNVTEWRGRSMQRFKELFETLQSTEPFLREFFKHLQVVDDTLASVSKLEKETQRLLGGKSSLAAVKAVARGQSYAGRQSSSAIGDTDSDDSSSESSGSSSSDTGTSSDSDSQDASSSSDEDDESSSSSTSESGSSSSRSSESSSSGSSSSASLSSRSRGRRNKIHWAANRAAPARSAPSHSKQSSSSSSVSSGSSSSESSSFSSETSPNR